MFSVCNSRTKHRKCCRKRSSGIRHDLFLSSPERAVLLQQATKGRAAWCAIQPENERRVVGRWLLRLRQSVKRFFRTLVSEPTVANRAHENHAPDRQLVERATNR